MNTIRTRLTRTIAHYPLHAAYLRRQERTAVRTARRDLGHARPTQSAHPIPPVLLSIR